MDIIVNGTAKAFFKPEQVSMEITFKLKESEYEKTLHDGTQTVIDFIEYVLPEIELSKDDLKTRSFKLREVYTTVYNQKTEERKQVFDGYEFSQSAQLKFDYDVKKMSTFMSKTAELKNPPSYVIDFEVKDIEARKNEILAKAYEAAKTKAQAIADAAGMKLIKCLKTDFKTFDSKLSSHSRLSDSDLDERASSPRKAASFQKSLEQTFTPEDVRISETLYCLWLAE